MMKKRIVIGFLASLLLLFSCNEKFYELKDEVDQIAENMNDIFLNGTVMCDNLSDVLVGLVVEDNLENVDIAGMDEKNGGAFYTDTKDNVETYRERYVEGKKGFILGSLGINPVSERTKKQLFSLRQQEAEIMDIIRTVKDEYIAEITSSGTARLDVGFHFPYSNIFKYIQYPFDFGEYAQAGFYKTEARDRTVYRTRTISVPSSDGMFHSAGRAVTDENDEIVSYILFSLKPYKIAEDLIAGHEKMILIVFWDTNVFGITQKAMDVLKVKRMIDYDDFIQTLNEDDDAVLDFRLTSEKQLSDIREFGELILPENLGRTDLKINIYGKKYRAYMANVPEAGYIVIGLL